MPSRCAHAPSAAAREAAARRSGERRRGARVAARARARRVAGRSAARASRRAHVHQPRLHADDLVDRVRVVRPVHHVLGGREPAQLHHVAVLREELAVVVGGEHQRDRAHELQALLVHVRHREVPVDGVHAGEEHVRRQLQLLVQLDQPVHQDAGSAGGGRRRAEGEGGGGGARGAREAVSGARSGGRPSRRAGREAHAPSRARASALRAARTGASTCSPRAAAPCRRGWAAARAPAGAALARARSRRA